jgi:hypothetical protein
MSCGGCRGLSMTSLGSRRLLLSGSELKERGRREAPLLFVKIPQCRRSLLHYGVARLVLSLLLGGIPEALFASDNAFS